MAESVKLAFVGCGGIAAQHVGGYKELFNGGCRDVEYVACCDVNEDTAAGLAEAVAAVQGSEPKVFTDLDEMLDAGIAEGADVCLPHWLHHSAAIQCLEGGLHVMVEKPIGITVKATRKIIEAGKKAGKVVATAEQIRRMPAPRAFRWAIAERKLIGDVHMVCTKTVMHNPLDLDMPRMQWRALKLLTGGGLIMDSGAHYADMMIHLFGDVDEVYCTIQVLDQRMVENPPAVESAPVDVESTWHAIIRFKSGVEATWTYSRSFHGPNEQSASFYGSDGTIYNDRVVFHPFQLGGRVLLEDGTEMSNEDVIAEYMATLSDDEKNRLFPYGCESGFGVQMWDFADAIRNGREPEMDGEAGLRAKALCETCYESAAAGEPVKYDDVLSGEVCEYQRPIDEYWQI